MFLGVLGLLGPVELVAVVGMVILAVVVHIVIMLAGRQGPDTARHRAWLVYGIPVCWAAAAILTPPDPLTMLAVAVPCSLLYGVPVLIWGLR